jgi:hypothetical protein
MNLPFGWMLGKEGEWRFRHVVVVFVVVDVVVVTLCVVLSSLGMCYSGCPSLLCVVGFQT